MASEDLLLLVEHVKYRKAGEGRSPIGVLRIFSEHVEWADATPPETLVIKFIQIRGQRVSPPNKTKVQLQVVLQNDDQATFVFLNPTLDKDALLKERDTVKETLQNALLAHRQRVNQLTSTNEKDVKTAELEAKQRILRENKQLEQLYTHLVSTKLITPPDFWADYYSTNGVVEERTGVNGAFLAGIVQQDGTNGLKLNLNGDVIRAIFSTYPAVERKHLELVPHEMTEQQFWSKFFVSHYFHRSREVTKNPNDPFHDCGKIDDEEIAKLVGMGITRQRFDLNHIDGYELRDMPAAQDAVNKDTPKITLVKRCNFLSERLASSFASEEASSSNAPVPESSRGFGALNRAIHDDETRLESTDLANDRVDDDVVPLTFQTADNDASMFYSADDAKKYKGLVLNFLDKFDVDRILDCDSILDSIDDDVGMNGHSSDSLQERHGFDFAKCSLSESQVAELKIVHDAVIELCKHFWVCFPPTTPELETKLERMEETLRKYESAQLLQAEQKFGAKYVQHCREMLAKAHERYQLYLQRQKR